MGSDPNFSTPLFDPFIVAEAADELPDSDNVTLEQTLNELRQLQAHGIAPALQHPTSQE